MRARTILVMSLVLVLLTAGSLSAQTFRGTVLGTVTDPSGAVIGGAKVTVKNTGTGLVRSTQTSADGSYSLPELPIGTYNVTLFISSPNGCVDTVQGVVVVEDVFSFYIPSAFTPNGDGLNSDH